MATAMKKYLSQIDLDISVLRKMFFFLASGNKNI